MEAPYAATDGEAGERAKAEVEALGAEIKVGSIYEGKVVSTKDFGAFVEIAPGTDGMVHISELAEGYVSSVDQVVKIGDTMQAAVINVDDNGRIKLSRKALIEGGKGPGDGAPVTVGDGNRPPRREGGDRGDRGGDRGDRGDRGGDRGDRKRGRGGRDRGRKGGSSGGGGGEREGQPVSS